MSENRRQGSELSRGGQFSLFGTWDWRVREGYYVYPGPDWQFLEIKELVLTLDKDHRPGLTINWGSKEHQRPGLKNLL
jgi:hypothetical protein